MESIKFKIAFGTDRDWRTVEVEGWRPDSQSMIAVHRPEDDKLLSITFLPTGTKINSLFPDQLRKPACKKLLLEFIAKIEAAELPSWLVLSTLPWGCKQVPDDLQFIVDGIRATAKAL